MPRAARRRRLEGFHGFGLRLAGLVVLAEKMQRAMDEEVSGVMVERFRLLRTLAQQRVVRKDDIAEGRAAPAWPGCGAAGKERTLVG